MEASKKRWSRYRTSEVLKYEVTDPATGDTVEHHYLEARYPIRKTYADSSIYMVNEGDELDQLAFRYYGKEELWWIIADANRIDDRMAAKTAWDIAKRIENELAYPGEVKVTLIREVRSVEYAR